MNAAVDKAQEVNTRTDAYWEAWSIPANTQVGLGGAAKRVLDVVGSLFALAICLPLIAIISFLIKADTRGSIFFRQERIGHQGRRFIVYKFRSMLENAEDKLAEVSHNNEIKDGPIFKWRQDPRITRVGRFLRRTSLDELPQFLNVLIGNMSLVGPRPPLAKEVALYEEWQLGRLTIKPGMTGLWQVSGRSTLTFGEMVRFDLAYIDGWTIWRDLALIARTPIAVFTGRGAF